MCKGSFDYDQEKYIWGGSERSKGYVNFTIKLFFKDGRYKYVFTDFRHSASHGGVDFGIVTDEVDYPGKLSYTTKGWRKKIWNDLKSQIAVQVEKMEVSLIDYMKETSESEKDSW